MKLDLVFLVYIDDKLIPTANPETLAKVKGTLKTQLKITDMGIERWFLGMDVIYKLNGFFVTQTMHVCEILEIFTLEDAKSQSGSLSKDLNFQKSIFPESNDLENFCSYRELVRLLLYLIVCTCPGISLEVSQLSHFVSDPHESHCNLLKGVVRYFKESKNLTFFHTKGNGRKFLTFVDAFWDDDVETRRSTTGILIFIG